MLVVRWTVGRRNGVSLYSTHLLVRIAYGVDLPWQHMVEESCDELLLRRVPSSVSVPSDALRSSALYHDRPDDKNSDDIRKLLWKKTKHKEEEGVKHKQKHSQETDDEEKALIRVLEQNGALIVVFAIFLVIAWYRKRSFDQKGLHKKTDYSY